MRKILICVAAMGTALAAASPAAAQYYPQPYGNNGYGYNAYGNNGYGYNGYGYRGYGGGAQAVCSGQRGYSLENRLRNEQREGEIDPYAAGRIHEAIDRLEAQQRRECAEGDWRSIARLSNRYDRIGQWIDSAAHGYQRWDR